MTRIGDWMQTHSGRRFYPLDPRPEDVCIGDIAHALAHLCRFGGHSKHFYSVAEHSVLTSLVVPPEHALHALLHDATEAYCVDVPRPLKRGLGAAYATIEHRIWGAIAHALGVGVVLPDCVKAADDAVLLAERDVLFDHPLTWSVPGKAADVRVLGLQPDAAKRLFMARYVELTA